MIGWLSGNRHCTDLENGLNTQTVTCKTELEAKLWREMIPDGQPLTVEWTSEMQLRLNGHSLIFQSVHERDQWRSTFPRVSTHRPYARWISPLVLVLGSEPTAPVIPGQVVAPLEPSNDTLTDPQLRTRLIEAGIAFDEDTPRAVLLEMLNAAAMANLPPTE